MRETDIYGTVLPKVARSFGGKCAHIKDKTKLVCFRKPLHKGKHRANAAQEW